MTVTPYTSPPGLVGEIANYIYAQAPRPSAAVALAASIGLISGIAGRAFNVLGAGLNTYTLVLAPTGTGKEAGADGIDRLINAVINGTNGSALPAMPSAAQFVGPSRFASEVAIEKHIAGTSNSFVSIIGEFGLALNKMSNPRASVHDEGILASLLKLYGKSGHGSVYRGSSYADAKNNISDVRSPALSIYAESTQETVFDRLTEGMVKNGLLPRFTIIEHEGPRPALNLNYAHATPSATIVEALSALCVRAHELNAVNEVVTVTMDEQADYLFKALGDQVDAVMNAANDEVSRHLWSRVYLKAVKLAALVAVGLDLDMPTITRDIAEWAINLEVHATNKLAALFDDGKVGEAVRTANTKQDKVRAVMNDWLMRPWSELERYLPNAMKAHEQRVIPWSYISKRLTSNPSFRGPNASRQIRETVDELIKFGEFFKLRNDKIKLISNSHGDYYFPAGENHIFDPNYQTMFNVGG